MNRRHGPMTASVNGIRSGSYQDSGDDGSDAMRRLDIGPPPHPAGPESIDKSHGRLRTRRTAVCTGAVEYLGWPNRGGTERLARMRTAADLLDQLLQMLLGLGQRDVVHVPLLALPSKRDHTSPRIRSPSTSRTA